jgi:hypothetical protein
MRGLAKPIVTEAYRPAKNNRLRNGRYWRKAALGEAAMSEKCARLGHCIGFGAFVSPSNAFVVYDPMSPIR